MQAAAPSKCVLHITCVIVRRHMKICIFSGTADHRKDEMEIRDLGCRLDTSLRGRAGTIGGIQQDVE